MRTTRTHLLFAALCFTACAKETLDTADLTTNPFDADYNGASVFIKEAERTVPYTVGGEMRARLEIDVRVERSLLPSGSSFGVSYRAPGVSAGVAVPADELADDRFTVSVLDVQAGTNYCVEVRLTNGGGAGGGNALCGTAE